MKKKFKIPNQEAKRIHRVSIWDEEKYADAMEIIIKMGGTITGIQSPNENEHIIFVSHAHYNALVDNGVIPAEDKKEIKNGKKRKKKSG